MVNSKKKGDGGELELSKVIAKVFPGARRSKQYCGDAGDSDIIAESIPEFAIESKRTQNRDFNAWLAKQATQAPGKAPVICHRRNYERWTATMYLEDWLDLVKKAQAAGRISKEAKNQEQKGAEEGLAQQAEGAGAMQGLYEGSRSGD